MKRHSISILSLSLFILLLGSCQQLFMDKRAKLVLKNTDGLLRGVDMDMTLPEVKKLEKDSIHEESPSFLGYRLPGSEKNESLELEYNFNDKGKLDLVLINYFLEKDEDAENMIAALKKHFDKKLGASKQDEKGWQVWEYQDKKGIPGNLEVVLDKTVDDKGKVVNLQVVKYYDSDIHSSRMPGKK